MVGLELFGQSLGGGQPLGRVGLGEDEVVLNLVGNRWRSPA